MEADDVVDGFFGFVDAEAHLGGDEDDGGADDDGVKVQ